MSKSLTLFRIVSKQRNFGSLLFTQKRLYVQKAHSFIGNENPHTNYNTVVSVFGATGFIGKYVVYELARQGYQVIVPWKTKELAVRDHRVMGDVGQIVTIQFSLEDLGSIHDICNRSNIVINCAGTDFDKYGNTRELANVTFAEMLAKACKISDVDRFVHVSCLGATRHNSMDSIYFRTKGEGEFIVKREFPEVTIIRPAPVFGFEDRLLNFMAKCLRVLPGIPLIKRGAATIQPVYVGDIAAGIVRSLKKDEGEIYELAGPKRYKYHELGKYVAKVITEEYTGLPVPGPIASITGYLNEFVWRPVWTRDFAKRMKYDIVLDENTKAKTFKDLGIEPQPLEKHAPTILKRWKRSGTAFLDVNYKL